MESTIEEDTLHQPLASSSAWNTQTRMRIHTERVVPGLRAPLQAPLGRKSLRLGQTTAGSADPAATLSLSFLICPGRMVRLIHGGYCRISTTCNPESCLEDRSFQSRTAWKPGVRMARGMKPPSTMQCLQQLGHRNRTSASSRLAPGVEPMRGPSFFQSLSVLPAHPGLYTRVTLPFPGTLSLAYGPNVCTLPSAADY